MNFVELKKLVAGGENHFVEFKLKANHPNKIVREAVAFANADGGFLIIGVQDNGLINGVKNPEEVEFIMEENLVKLIRPSLSFTKTRLDLNDHRAVFAYRVSNQLKKPYYALQNKNEKWGKAYIRVGDKSIQASEEVLKILRLKNKNVNRVFTYTEQHRSLLQVIEKSGFATLSSFQSHASISRLEASNILVDMVVNNVLTIFPSDEGDQYKFNE